MCEPSPHRLPSLGTHHQGMSAASQQIILSGIPYMKVFSPVNPRAIRAFGVAATQQARATGTPGDRLRQRIRKLRLRRGYDISVGAWPPATPLKGAQFAQ